MSYIIMAVDECGMETRLDFPDFATAEEAHESLAEARMQYPEYRSIWVEELRDMAYYAALSGPYDDWEYGDDE